MKYSCILLLIFLSTLLNPARGQERSYTHYDVSNGLAGTAVYAMAQDKDGFIWFGTETGLSRFDGTHFKNYTTHDGLPDNEILKIFVDSKNRVWIAPFKNTIAYYEHGRFHTQENDSLLRNIPITAPVEAIVEDSAGNILLKEVKKLHFIEKNGSIRSIGVSSSPGPAFMQVGLSKAGRFRFLIPVAGGGMSIFDLMEGDRFRKIRSTPTTWWNSPLNDYISPDLEIHLAYNKVFFYNPLDSTEFSISMPNGLVGNYRLNDSMEVIGTHSIAYLLDIRQKKIIDSFEKGGSFSSALEDSEGEIWLSTLDNGVYRLGSAGVGNYFFKTRGNKLGIFSIRKIDSILYLGGDHFFLSALNPRTGAVKTGTIYNGSSRGRIMDMVKTPANTLLVGTDLGTLDFKDFKHRPRFYFITEAIKSYQIVEDSTLLISSHLMVKYVKMQDRSVIDTLWRERSTCAFRDKDGLTYIGTVRGLYALKNENDSVFLGARYKALSNRIIGIVRAADGTLWIATDGEGIVGYRGGRVVAHISASEGMTSNICRAIFVADGNIWVGTDRGLNKIAATRDGYSIIHYTMSDGLSSDMINAIYVEGGDVYIGNSAGLTFFNEKKISKRSESLLRITGISVSDRQWPGDTTGFILPHRDNNIKFDFVGISFKSAGDIDYRYRLLGLDTGWKTTRETFLSYPSLPSGNYELQLIATNKFGVRSNPASIRFFVEKLLWEKWWFRLLVVGIIAAAVFLSFNYRLRLIKRKEAEKTETNTKMAELEQMALRSQMNPHFIFNCLNSIQQYVIYRDVLGANEFITKFSYLIRQTLDLSSKQTISLREEINYIDTYMSLERKRFENKFIYDITVGPEVDRDNCHILPMILQPYIENAVRHGIGPRKDNDGRLSVKMQYQEGFLACIVEDNGVGRKIARQYKSINSIAYQSVGMSLVAKRIKMINKAGHRPVEICIDDLEDSKGIALGTRIRILFPLETVLDSNH